MLLDAVLYGVLLPSLLAAAVLTGAVRGRTGEARERAAEIALPLAAALGFIAAWTGINGVPPWPPVIAAQWIPFAALGAAAASATLAAFMKPETGAPAHAGAGAAILAAGVYLTVKPLLDNSWEGPSRWMLPAATFGLSALYVILARTVSMREGDATGLSAFAATSGAGAAAFGLSGSAMLAQLSGALATVCGTLCLLLLKGGPKSGSFALPAGLVAAMVAANAYFYSELPVPAALILAASPAQALLAGRLLPGSLTGWKRVTATGILCLPAPLLAAWLAHTANPPVTYDY